MSHPVKSALIFSSALALCVWAYFPALGGGFLFDDLNNIYDNQLLKIENFSLVELQQASFSSYSGPLKRPVAMFSFALNHIFTGMDPFWMKLTNLVIHILNGLLIFFLIRGVLFHGGYSDKTASRNLALVISCIWILHPINATAVAYIVQRMTSLSTTFVLLALCTYLKMRTRTNLDWQIPSLSILLLLFWGLGLLTKEIGVVLSLYIFLVEWLVFQFRTSSRAEHNHHIVLWSILAVPWIGALVYAIYKPSFVLAGYAWRDFGPVERLMTQFRIITNYVIHIFIPDSRFMGIYQDNIEISRSLLTPLSTLLSFLVILAMVAAAFRLRRKMPLVCLGILWFFAGHIPESTIYPLELKFFHRNYLPSIGLILAVTLLLLNIPKNYRSYLYPLGLVLVLGFTASTRSLSYSWSGDSRMLLIEAINNPSSPRANFRAGQLFKNYALATENPEKKAEYRNQAISYFNAIDELPVENLTGKMGIVQTYVQTGEKPPQATVDQLIVELQTARFNMGMRNIFETYTDCFEGVSCVLEESSYLAMVDSVLKNEEVYPYFKRAVLASHARFLADYRGDYHAAIKSLQTGLNIYSILGDIRQLALYYEKLNMLDQVGHTLHILELEDSFGVHRKFIDEMRGKIGKKKNKG